MPLEKRNLLNFQDSDAETMLENDNSKDFKLTNENNEERTESMAALERQQEYIDEP